MLKARAHRARGPGRGIEFEHFSSASVFLDRLTQAHRWTRPGSWASDWVYRGQRDAAWPLVPAAWRKPTSPAAFRLAQLKREVLGRRHEFRRFIRRSNQGKPYENLLGAYAQGFAEFKIVLEFVEVANRLGHPVPGLERYLSLVQDDLLNELREKTPRFVIEPHPATTLAQHHGIPTRYLDWTRNPVIAAFFAACDVEDTRAAGDIAVWAIRLDQLNNCEEYKIQERFASYEVSRAGNHYLHAQDALFLYPVAACSYFAEHGIWPSIEDYVVLMASLTNSGRGDPQGPILVKLTLPVPEVGELLRLLWIRGVSWAHLMPTLDNAAKALQTRWRWQR